MRISDWSSDVCSSDLKIGIEPIPIMSLMTMIFGIFATAGFSICYFASPTVRTGHLCSLSFILALVLTYVLLRPTANNRCLQSHETLENQGSTWISSTPSQRSQRRKKLPNFQRLAQRSEAHTSELQSVKRVT